jgi:citrate lyase subunit beta/citryl-CoA lyase
MVRIFIIIRLVGLFMNHIATHARTFLFLPADRLPRLDKALASGAHMVILDLEDAVAPATKESARADLGALWLQLDEAVRARIAIRINATATPWHAQDALLLRQISSQGLGGVMLAKTESVAQLGALAQQCAGTALFPLVESAMGFAALHLIARAPGVARLVFGHLDFQIDLGMQCDPDERELDAVRFQFVCASRQAGLPGPVDGVTTQIKDTARLVQDAQRSRRFGFTGKLCIHPDQVDAVNAALGPTVSQVDWAQRVLAAASAQGAGAFQFEMKVIVASQARGGLQRESPSQIGRQRGGHCQRQDEHEPV